MFQIRVNQAIKPYIEDQSGRNMLISNSRTINMNERTLQALTDAKPEVTDQVRQCTTLLPVIFSIGG